jgi:hypothetical protein
MIYLSRFAGRLALALLVPRVRANDAHDAVAPNDLAVAADLLYRSQYFHFALLIAGRQRASLARLGHRDSTDS